MSSTSRCCRATATRRTSRRATSSRWTGPTSRRTSTRLLDATNRGLQAIPHDNLKTVIDEAYTAVGGLGPEISRFVKGSTALAIDARKNLDELTALIDKSKPVLDSQTDTSGAIQAWAAHLANITGQLQQQDQALAGVINKGAPAADEVRALFDRLQPTLPIVLANLVSVGEVAVTYQPRPRTAAGAAAAGRRGHLGHRCREPAHPPGLQGCLPELQPEPQPAATLRHGVPAGAAEASAVRRGLPGPRAWRPVLPDRRRTRRSTSAVPATCRARRSPANVPPP